MRIPSSAYCMMKRMQRTKIWYVNLERYQSGITLCILVCEGEDQRLRYSDHRILPIKEDRENKVLSKWAMGERTRNSEDAETKK